MEYTFYKLYKNTFERPPPPERRALFSKLYKQHDVKLIGVFRNRDNPLEYYMMTAYRDETHFREFIDTVKQIPEYTEMTRRVSEVRLSNEVTSLELTEL
ncbi:MAG: hypothetical protein ACXAE3_02840 [Candidatus Kariarchaeaceae archaeon]|jgi:hypothetical protein